MSQVQLAVRLPHTWCIADADAITAVTDAAEELGYWGVSVQDHLLADSAVSPCGSSHTGDDRNVYEAASVLSFVAGRTERVKLLAGVFVLPFHHPVMLAKSLATLDQLSKGRLIPGVGVGALLGRDKDAGQRLGGHKGIAAKEFEILDVRGNRGQQVDESIEAMTALWTQDSASFEGRHYSFHDVEMSPKPVQKPRPPIWVGGRSEAAHRRVARLADGWFPSQATVANMAEGRKQILEMANEFGRGDHPFGFGVNIFVAVDESSDTARQNMRDGLGRRFEGDEALFAATIAGDPASVIDQIRRYAAAGCQVFDLKFVPLTLESTLDQMRLVAREVMPALAEVEVGAAA